LGLVWGASVIKTSLKGKGKISIYRVSKWAEVGQMRKL